ncbi:MAG: DUF488 family protein [Alphaproteobacteria bacterium]|nr:DUF488 family protein [Alphaproteobacteria bacterium]
MIYTSYYAIIKKLIKHGFTDFVAISGWIPDFYKNLMNNSNDDKITYRRIIELSPRKDWFFDWKEGKFDNNEYVRLYYETVLNKLDINEISKRLKENSVLLCYEKPSDFCHRHLIADWLNKNNIDCKEF